MVSKDKLRLMKYLFLRKGIYFVISLLLINCSSDKSSFEAKIDSARKCLDRQYQYQKDLDGAIAFYTQAINIDSTKAFAFYSRALVYDQKGERIILESIGRKEGDSLAKPYFLNAIADLNKAIYLDPKISEYYRGRSSFYLSSYHFNFKRAQHDIDRILELNKEDYNALCSRGYIKFHYLKDSSSAFLDFQAAIRLKPDEIGAYSIWGDCYYECGSYYEAVEKYRIWVKLQPATANDVYALNRLIRAQIKAGDYYAVITNCEKIREYQPDNAEAYLYSAEAKIKLGMIDIGKKELLQSRKEGIESDLYYEYFGTEREKAERKNNIYKKWPLNDDFSGYAFYE